MNHSRYTRRLAALVPAALVAAAAGACSDVLDVQNPGAINVEQLSDTLNVPLFAATVVSDFQFVYDDIARNSSWLSDEMVSGHNFVGYREWDGRNMREERTELHNVYTFIHQARFSADTLAGKFEELYPQPTASQNLALARMRAYGGYSYTLLGELFCESPLRGDSAAVKSDDILRRAIVRYEQAIVAATAARGGGTALVPRADSLLNLARVGAARTYLNLGDRAKAIEFASQVPANFEFRSFYSDAKSELENVYYSSSIGTNQNLGVDVTFRNLNDRRVRHRASSTTGHNGTTPLFRPYQAPSFGGWLASGDTVPFQRTTSIRFSSGLEARYILAEAGGMNNAQLLAFLNERRAVGGQTALTALPADPQVEVRDQRRRDFFLDGHRVGDLRRYKRLYNVDQWPTGTHPDPFVGTYGTAECFIPALNERLSNPNY